MKIEEKFLQLTNHTYPYGTEDKLFDMLPDELEFDEFGNLFIKIGESDTMFTSHLDTATSANCPVNHVIEDTGNSRIIKTDGKSILGADCKAGVVIMLYMIEKQIPGLYYFFLGEEVGCVGSKKVAAKHKEEPIPGINKVVSFDRRGLDSIITYQSNGRCCSDEFGKELSKQLNSVEKTFKYDLDPTGIYTDSAQFIRVYPECTNISVGYYSEHTFSERQDIKHLEKLAEACTKVDWESLPVKRDKTETDYGYGYSSRGWGWDDDDWYGSNYKTYYASTKPKVELEKEWFHDLRYNFISYFTIEKSTGFYKEVDISDERLSEEIDLLYNFFNDVELDYSSFNWDGVNLKVHFDDERNTNEANRSDLASFLTEFDLVKLANEYEDYYDGKYTVENGYF